MEKLLNIDGRQVKFKSTGAFLLRYKAQFHRDALKDIFKLQDAMTETEDENGNKVQEIKNIDALDFEVFYNLIWVLAKTADSSIEPPLEWLDGFNAFPLMDIIPEVFELIMSCITSTVDSKKK